MLVKTTQIDHIGIIHFQNGELNLLSHNFISELNKALDTLEKDEKIRVIVLSSDKKVFCAGADLTELRSIAETNNQADLQNVYDPIAQWQRLSHVSKPVIACVRGACLGGGLEIALMCDFIIASDVACFGFPEIKLGLLPGGGGTQRILHRINLAHAHELIMLGDSISAEKALYWGLINSVTTHDECFDNAIQFALKLASHSTPSLKAIKKLLALSLSDGFAQKLNTERFAFYEQLKTSDVISNIQRFLARKR